MNVTKANHVIAAAAATRLVLARDERYVVAELGGVWRHDAFSRGRGVPPVLKLIDLQANKVVATANGWALGSPVDKDLLYIEEHGEEYRYRVRSTARPDQKVDLTPPDGSWSVKAAIDVGADLVAAVLWSGEPGFEWRDGAWREQLWIATIHRRDLRIQKTTTLHAMRTPRNMPQDSRGKAEKYGGGVIGDPVRGQLYLAQYPAPGSENWHVAAYDASLEPLWDTELVSEARKQEPTETRERGGERRRAEPAPIPSTGEPPDARDQLAAITVTGNGAYVVVVRGSNAPFGGIGRPAEAFFLDPTTGKVTKAVELDLAGSVREIVPVAGQPRIGLLHVTAFRDRGDGYADRFEGVSVLDAPSGTLDHVYRVAASALGRAGYEAAQALRPGAIAIDASGAVLLAPQDYQWAEKHLGATGLPQPASDGRGLDAPEIRGLVSTPSDWHQDSRPRVKERDAFLATCEAAK